MALQPVENVGAGILTCRYHNVDQKFSPRQLPPEHHDANLIRPKPFWQRTLRLQPSANELTTRILRPPVVDPAAVPGAVGTRLTRIHGLAVDGDLQPPVTARGATTALPNPALRRTTTALLVLLSASAGAGVVTARLHGFSGASDLKRSIISGNSGQRAGRRAVSGRRAAGSRREEGRE